jgi:hypothetical protein
MGVVRRPIRSVVSSMSGRCRSTIAPMSEWRRGWGTSRRFDVILILVWFVTVLLLLVVIR